MSTPALSTVQYVILCCLAWRGPQTPYQLKDYIARVVSWVWDFPHTQLYTEPPKLCALGLLREDREEQGRRRRTYTITEEGLAVVRAWLAEPPTKAPQIRDLGLLKLHFSAVSEPEAVRRLARSQVEVHTARARSLAAALAESDADPAHRRYVRSGGRYGLASEELSVAFWRDVAADPERCAEAARRGGATVEPFRPSHPASDIPDG